MQKTPILLLLLANSAIALTVQNVVPGNGAATVAVSASEGETSEFVISATDAQTISYQWTVDGHTVSGDSAALSHTFDFGTVVHPAQSRLVTVACLLQAGAESATVTWDAVSVADKNRAPELGGATAVITPGRPTIEHRLRCTLLGRGLDPDPEDNANLRYLFTWRGDGFEAQQIANAPANPLDNPQSFLDNVELMREQVWTCEVEVIDIRGALSAPATATATILNSPPILESVDIITDTPALFTSTFVSMSNGVSDLESDSVNLFYEWLVNGHPVPGEVGPELDNFPTPVFRMGDVVQVVVTPSDGIDDGNSVSSAEIRVSIGWRMTFALDGTGDERLTIGMDDNASDAQDEFDEHAPADAKAILVTQDGERLVTDIRSGENSAGWQLSVDTQSGAREISWTGRALDFYSLPQITNHRLTVQSLDATGHAVSSGTFFVAQAGRLQLPAGRIHTFRLVIDETYKTSLDFEPGWNLFALPLGAEIANTAALPSPALAFGAEGFLRSPQLASFVGYWAHCARPLSVPQSALTLSSGQPPLAPGWNLIGTGSGVWDIADLDIVVAWYWDERSGAYRRATTLFPGRGYWAYVAPMPP